MAPTLRTRKPVRDLNQHDLETFHVWEYAIDEEGVAGQDEIVNSKVARMVFELAGTPEGAKTWRQWDEARHTLCWDPLTPQIVDEVAVWIRQEMRK